MATGFVILLLALVLVVFYLYQSQNWHGPIINLFIVAFVISVLVSFVYAYAKNPVDFTEFDGVVNFLKAYFSWLNTLIKNTSRIVGYVVSQDWGVNATAAG